MDNFLIQTDEETNQLVEKESERQNLGLELIPSENYVSEAILQALGSVFTNKYSEGYPGRRYYGGQEFTDKIETLAIERARSLFNCRYANVQTLSGAAANIAMYFALLSPGDTVLGMDLSHGGHLTHGHPVTHVAKMFNFIRYGMKDIETGEIDYEGLAELARLHKPKMLLVGFSAYSRNIDYEKISAIAKEVGAYAVADVAHIAGLIAGQALANPLDYGFDCLTATTHKTLRGPRGGLMLCNDGELAKKIDRSVFPGLQGGPHMNVIAAKAVAFKEALQPSFKEYVKNILKNAKVMENVFRDRGIRMIAGGTDNHLLLLDVWRDGRGISGKEAEERLDSVGITVNKNVIADDIRPPLDPSGIRLGTPAITTRGFTVEAVGQLTEIICDVLESNTEEVLVRSREKVVGLARLHPIPKIFI